MPEKITFAYQNTAAGVTRAILGLDRGWVSSPGDKHTKCVIVIEPQPAYSIRDRGNAPHLKSGCMAATYTFLKSLTECLAKRGRPCMSLEITLLDPFIKYSLIHSVFIFNEYYANFYELLAVITLKK